MANSAIPHLPPVLGVTGSDLFELVQGGTSSRASINQIIEYILGTNMPVIFQQQYLAPTAWSDPTTGYDVRQYATVRVTVDVAPTTTYTPQWSADNATWFPAAGLDLNYNQVTSITSSFTGSLAFPANGYMRLSGGTGGTFLISASQ